MDIDIKVISYIKHVKIAKTVSEYNILLTTDIFELNPRVELGVSFLFVFLIE